MVKKIIILLGLLILVYYRPAAATPLSLTSPEQTHILSDATLKLLLSATATPVLIPERPSLANYFYKQISALPAPNRSSQPIHEAALGEFLMALADMENRPPQNAELTIVDGRASDFAPHRNGQILDLAATRRMIIQALDHQSEDLTLALPLHITRPLITLADLNELGIRELLVRGESDFSGSSRSRIQNIKVGASRYNGIIILPGEEFSFNKYLGPIDAAHGFLPELVIKPQGTVPEFGGGLCQVSTTAFRAAFFGGLPITQRKNHSYAVKYYTRWINPDIPGAEGLDATIYPGAVDMKFRNDTAGAILIWTRLQDTRLYFYFYGTPDDRQVVVDGPHPYDRRASGAVKSKVARTVSKPDQDDDTATFFSNYVSPDLYPRIYEYPEALDQNEKSDNNKEIIN